MNKKAKIFLGVFIGVLVIVSVFVVFLTSAMMKRSVPLQPEMPAIIAGGWVPHARDSCDEHGIGQCLPQGENCKGRVCMWNSDQTKLVWSYWITFENRYCKDDRVCMIKGVLCTAPDVPVNVNGQCPAGYTSPDAKGCCMPEPEQQPTPTPILV